MNYQLYRDQSSPDGEILLSYDNANSMHALEGLLKADVQVAQDALDIQEIPLESEPEATELSEESKTNLKPSKSIDNRWNGFSEWRVEKTT